MKILYLSASTLPSYDANSVNVINMCSSFLYNGHKVTLIGNKGLNKIEIKKYYDLENLDDINMILVEKNSISFLSRIIKSIIPAFKADIIFTRWILGAFIFSVVFRRNIILELHSLSNNKLKGDLLINLIFKSKKIKKVIFITEALRKKYTDKFGELDGIDKMVLPGAANISKNVQVNSETVDCGYIGSFKKGKGIDTIIKIAEKMPNIKFHVVGGKDNEIKEIISHRPNLKNIIWYGNLPFQEAQEKFKLFEIALLPNKKNVMIANDDIGEVTSPNKLFEYMSNGKAIISSDLPVLKEILINNKNGILVNENDVSEWVKAINFLIQNKGIRQQMQEEALAEVKAKYNWKKRAKLSLEGIYNEN